MEEVVYVFCGGGFEGYAVGEQRAGSVYERGAKSFHCLFLSSGFFFFLCFRIGWAGIWKAFLSGRVVVGVGLYGAWNV